MLAIKTSLYRGPFSKLKPCILRRNLVWISFRRRMDGYIRGRNDSMFHLERFLVCTVFIINVYKALVLICQQTDFVL